jgi:hypothetical protein
MGSFQTSDEHGRPELRPLRVAMRREDLFAEARTMVEDLDGWTLVRADEEGLALHCERKGGLLGGTARVTLSVEGPDGIPSATLTVRSESEGGLLSRDKAVVAEFLTPFARRVV